MPYWAVPDFAALLGDIEKACRDGAKKALDIRPGMKREIKPDGSIVTDADRTVETLLRERIAAMTPGAPVWGEELGYEAPNEKGLWLLDPIDGTSNFAFGQPLWGVTAAYFAEGAVQFGAICIPEMGWTFTAINGQGAYLNGSRLPKVKSGTIEPYELVVFGDVRMANNNDLPGKVRHLGSFVVEAGIFARGGMRALLTNGVRMYDAAAGVVIAREVGAEVREMDGSLWEDALWTRPVRCRTFGFFPPDSGWPFGAVQSQ